MQQYLILVFRRVLQAEQEILAPKVPLEILDQQVLKVLELRFLEATQQLQIWQTLTQLEMLATTIWSGPTFTSGLTLQAIGKTLGLFRVLREILVPLETLAQREPRLQSQLEQPLLVIQGLARQ